MKRRKGIRYATLLVVMAGLWACQEKQSYDGERTVQERAQLEALTDSMSHVTPRAIPLIQEAMRQAKDSLTWYDYHLLYGRHYLLSNSPDSLLPYADKTLNFATSTLPQTPRTRGLAASALSARAAYLNLLHHDADSVVAMWKKAYDLTMESDIKETLPDLSANLGDAYINKGDIPEASRWYRRALFLVDSLGLPTSKNLTLFMGLGRIYTMLKDFDQAREYYEMADKRFDKMKPNMQSYFLNNYGNYFYYSQQYEKALQTFRRMQAHLGQYHADDHFDMYLCKINLADVFLNLHQTDSATWYVTQAEEYFQQQGVNLGVYYAHTIRIGIALQEKRYAEVAHILKTEGDLGVTDNDMIDIRQRYLSKYHAAVGHYLDAYRMLTANNLRTDSTESHRRKLHSRDIMIQLTEDTMRLHHQLALQEHEAAYTRSRAMAWFLFSVLVIASLTIALWVNNERKRRLKSKLENTRLQLANARQRISPHFVFNVLNSIRSDGNGQDNERLLMLARLIRSNLDLTSQEQVTLAEELDFVQQYVEIERMLIGEDFTFTVEAPDREVLQQVQLPSMLIQIIAENAIMHAIKGREGQKLLRIVVEHEEQQTCVSVIDNGPGFDMSKANERLRTGMNIIRTTVAAVNQHSKTQRLHFDIKNDHGCHATLTIKN